MSKETGNILLQRVNYTPYTQKVRTGFWIGVWRKKEACAENTGQFSVLGICSCEVQRYKI